MINWQSTAYLLELGFLKISSHGFFMALGILIAYFFCRREILKNKKLNADIFDNIVLFSVLGGVLGARILYFVLHISEYNLLDFFKVWEGGLSSFGGIIGGTLFGIIYLKYKKVDFRPYADILAPYLLLGWGVGRIGDFVLWSEYGTYTNLPWGIVVDNDEARHPTQIYTLIFFTLAFFLIQNLKKAKNKTSGYYFYLSMLIFFAFRFLLEFIMAYPGETSIINYNVFSQGISLIAALISFYFIRHENKYTKI